MSILGNTRSESAERSILLWTQSHFNRLKHAKDLHELGKMFIKSTLLPRPKSDGNMHSVVAGGAAAAAAAAANGGAAPAAAAAVPPHSQPHHQGGGGGSNFPSFFPLKKLHKAGFHKSENTLYPSNTQVTQKYCRCSVSRIETINLQNDGLSILGFLQLYKTSS